MLLQCTNCGAPLDGRAAKTSIKCNYCGAVQQTESLAVQHQEVPTGWKPPPVWIAPAHFAAAGQNLNYRKTMAGIQAVVMIAVFAPIVLGGIGTAVATRASFPSFTRSGSGSTAWTNNTWDGKSTYRCDGGASPTLSGRVSQNLATGIEASGGCHLTMNGGTINASDIGLRADGNSHLELHNVRIVMKGHGEVGIRASGNAFVELFDCHLEMEHGGGEAIALEASGNAKIKFYSGGATGHYAVRAKDLAQVNVITAEVRGKVESSGSASVSGVQSTGADDCNCPPHDHACKHRCKKNR
jgi:hypothetical protein